MNIQSKQAAADKLRAALDHFTGSEQVFYGALNKSIVYTEGVQHFAQHAGGGAYWLLDILTTQPEILKQAEDFAVVELHVTDDNTARLWVHDGDQGPGPVTAYERQLDYTDCPPGEWKFFMCNRTIMLPGEY